MSGPAFIAQAAQTFVQRRWLQARLRTRADLEAFQHRQIARFLGGPARNVSAFNDVPKGAMLADFPKTDKAIMLADFAAFNRLALNAAQAWQHVQGAPAPRGYAVGASTGTSGTQGLYLVSDRERAQWLGLMLAKLLPHFWRRRARIAVCLPRNSGLYDGARQSGFLQLAFYDLNDPLDRWADALAQFDLTHVIAPPAILQQLAALPRLAPQRVYSAAEVLEPDDRTVLEARFGPLGHIYMATEGVLATSCAKGTLHLCEDALYFELDGDRLVKPRITEFSRTTQIMVRYAMNDFLEIGSCDCGSPLQAVTAVHGRNDDVLRFGERFFTPDILRNAIMAAAPRAQDYRLKQTGPTSARLEMGLSERDKQDKHGDDAADRQAAAHALTHLFTSWGVKCDLTVQPLAPPPLTGGPVAYKKRRRIQGLTPC